MATYAKRIVQDFAGDLFMMLARLRRRKNTLTTSENPFLKGIHLPMKEQLSIGNLTTSGTIPSELAGSYLRIGPNPIQDKTDSEHHWFLGDGMVHGIHLKNGKAEWYKNRYIRSSAVCKALGEKPPPGPRNGRFDTVNTNVLKHADKIWALVEASSFPVELDQNLNTISYNAFENTLKSSFSAHPKKDPETGNLHAIAYDAYEPSIVRHIEIGANGRVCREQSIKVQNGPMIHDCAITKNFVIILDLPVTFSMRSALSGDTFPYRWNPSHQSRVGLLPRGEIDGDVIWCSVDPCFVFHTVNSYEQEDGSITLDVCCHDSMFSKSTQGPDSETSFLERWIIHPKTRSVSRCVLDATSQEFPRYNESRTGTYYRYAYTVSAGLEHKSGDKKSRNCIIKHDLANGSRQVRRLKHDQFPGEFTFVSKKECDQEDDGWLMGLIINAKSETTDFVIFEARDLRQDPIATVSIPHMIPYGFHGNWCPDE